MQKNVWDKKRIVETITEDLSADNAVVFANNDSDNVTLVYYDEIIQLLLWFPSLFAGHPSTQRLLYVAQFKHR